MSLEFRTTRALRLGLVAMALCVEVSGSMAWSNAAQAQGAPAATRNPNANVSCNDPGPRDYPIAGGWFYTQEGRGCIQGVGPSRYRGYLVVDDARAAFWTEFRRYGGLDVLGYPVSQRYHYPITNPSGYWYQAFERGILQWRPETGRAELANVFEQFTDVGLDADLEALGIPQPMPADSGSGFAADAERRMSWLSEPRFLARYFFDPVAAHSSDPDRAGQAAFTTQEQAWAFFGLPQSMPAQVGLLGPAPGRVPLYPLVHTFLAQRFQKSAMELFLEDAPPVTERFLSPTWTGSPDFLFDPTIVPGDGRKGCVALTAVGLLARTVGLDKVIPSEAILAMPLDPSPNPFVESVVPPVDPAQLTLQFQLSGSNFAPFEPITLTLTDAQPSSAAALTTTLASPPGGTLPTLPSTSSMPLQPLTPVTTHVRAANKDGSFDQVETARVGMYLLTVTGDLSGKSFSGVVDLTSPSLAMATTQLSAGCRDVGLPVAS